ncbi:hypothetical protein [uncultured Rhodospira sp.]|mgnify:CR=1 FL=1|uniref:hypothetical protein n=1 Tax=uncultured Rhodospira sp. TaxID=1936189 RepID=UPI00262851B4|nr:hypothetical protein [uncultured Rhodospira sp.]
MSTVPPPVPPQPPARPAAPAPATLTVVDPPRALAEAQANAVLQARVIQAAQGGRLAVVQTDLGQMNVRTSLPLPAGTDLSLNLLSLARGTALMRITALNGQPLQSAPPSAGAPATAAPGPAASGTPGALLTTGPAAGTGAVAGTPDASTRGLLTATVLRGAGTAGSTDPAASASTQWPAGTRLTVRVMAIQPPGSPGVVAGTAGGAGPAPAAADVTAPNAAAARGSAAPPASGAPTPTGQVARLPIAPPGTAVTPGAARSFVSGPTTPGASTPSAGSSSGVAHATGGQAAKAPAAQGDTSQAPNRLTGLLTGQPSGAQSLIRTPSGTLALPVRLDAPPGSQISLSIVSSAPPASTGVGAAPAVPQGGGQGWPALSQAVDTLARTDPAAARALESAIPRPGPQLAAAMVTVAGALRAGGDARQWPGDATMRALDRAGPAGRQAAETLRQDLTDLAGRVRESPGGEWRALTLPLSDQAEISAISVILRVIGGRGDPPEDAEGRPGQDGDGGQRFLVDVTLSRLGRMQLDGLVETPARRLRLILRTAAPLPADLRADLSAIATNSLEALGLEGGLTFRADGAFVDPMPATSPKSPPPPTTPPGGVFA